MGPVLEHSVALSASPRAPIPSVPTGHRGSTRMYRLLGCQPVGELTRKGVLFHPC